MEGEKIYPEDEPCKECICGAGFNGKLVNLTADIFLKYEVVQLHLLIEDFILATTITTVGE